MEHYPHELQSNLLFTLKYALFILQNLPNLETYVPDTLPPPQ